MGHTKGHSTLPHRSGDLVVYHLERRIHLTQRLNTSAAHGTHDHTRALAQELPQRHDLYEDKSKGPTYVRSGHSVDEITLSDRQLMSKGSEKKAARERERERERRSPHLDPLTSSDSRTAQCARARIPHLQTARTGRASQGAYSRPVKGG